MARPGRPERNRAARSFRQFRRFRHVINSDKVFGSHSRHSPEEKGRSQRTVPMRLRKEIQEMLRPQLIVAAVLTGGLLSSKRDRSLADELELPKTLSARPNVNEITVGQQGRAMCRCIPAS